MLLPSSFLFSANNGNKSGYRICVRRTDNLYISFNCRFIYLETSSSCDPDFVRDVRFMIFNYREK